MQSEQLVSTIDMPFQKELQGQLCSFSELLKLATAERPLLIFLDSVDELTGSQVFFCVLTGIADP